MQLSKTMQSGRILGELIAATSGAMFLAGKKKH